MSSFFSKVGSALQLAKQGSAQIISSVNKAITTATISAPAPKAVELSKTDELTLLFKEICEIIEYLALLPDADSIDTDAKVSQTPLRQKLKRMVEILQEEGDGWQSSQRYFSEADEEQSAVPCIDHFIQLNVVSELCNRAMNDTPRGIMRLILTTMSTLLRAVSYPLLPHQSIYRPMAKLIFVASRYEAFIQLDVSVKMPLQEREKYTNYMRRKDISLTSLLRTIWRKIIENPPCLDYFIVADRRTSSVDQYVESSRGMPKMQIDVLSALLPLIHHPKVGHFAQESVLMALNIRDTRVDFYLAYNTGFTFSLVRNVCDDFNAALIFLQRQLTVNSQIIVPTHLLPFCTHNAFNAPAGHSNHHNLQHKSNTSTSNTPKTMTPSTSKTNLASSTSSVFGFFPSESYRESQIRMNQDANAARTKQRNEEATYNAVVSFLNSLSFLRAVFSSLRSRETAFYSKDSDAVESEVGSPEGAPGVQHCLQRISDTFYAEFVLGCLQSALDTTNEVQNTVVYILLKLLLSHLARGDDFDGDSSMLILTTNRRKLYDSRRRCHLTLLGEVLNFLLRKPTNDPYEGSRKGKKEVTSANVEAATSTMPTSSLSQTKVASLAGHLPSGYYVSVVDRAASLSKSLSLSSNLLLFMISSVVPPIIGLELLHYQSSASGNANGSTGHVQQLVPLPFEVQTMSFDDALARCCTALELEGGKEGNVQPAAFTKALHPYIQTSMQHLFRKLFHRGDEVWSLIDMKASSSSGHSSIPAAGTHAPGTEHFVDTLLHRVLKRLQTYSTLRIDEQIALSGLVNEISCLLCVSMLLGDESQARNYLQQYYTLLRKVTTLRTELQRILHQQVSDGAKKVGMVRAHLHAEAIQYLATAHEEVDPTAHVPPPPPIAAAVVVGSTSAGGVAQMPPLTPQHQSRSSSMIGSASGMRAVPTTASVMNSLAHGNPSSSSSSSATSAATRKRMIDNESVQNKSILTSAIVLQEMEREVLGYVFALRSTMRLVQEQRELTQRSELAGPRVVEDLLDLGVDVSSQASPVVAVWVVEARRVDEEEYREDREDLDAYRGLLHTLNVETAAVFGGAGNSASVPIVRKDAASLRLLDIDQREREFEIELEAMEGMMDAMLSSIAVA